MEILQSIADTSIGSELATGNPPSTSDTGKSIPDIIKIISHSQEKANEEIGHHMETLRVS